MLTRHQISGPTLLLSILGKSAGTVLTGAYRRSIVAIVTDADALLPDGALASASGASPPRWTLASRHCRTEIRGFFAQKCESESAAQTWYESGTRTLQMASTRRGGFGGGRGAASLLGFGE